MNQLNMTWLKEAVFLVSCYYEDYNVLLFVKISLTTIQLKLTI